MSATREETAAPEIWALVTGHLIAPPGYQTWRPHGTDDYLLMLTLSGAGRIGWEAGALHTQTGDLVLLHPRTRHDYGIAPNAPTWDLLWTHFVPYPHWRDLLKAWPHVAPGIAHLRLDPSEQGAAKGITDALWEMHRRATGGRARREQWAMNALEEALLHCDALNPLSAGAHLDPRIADAVRHLRQHFAEPFYLPHLAARVGLSPSRLSHRFRGEVGQTPREFVETERLSRAAQLLALTSRPIHAIAQEVGYDNPFYFTLRFKAVYGLAPREYRKRRGGQERESGSGRS